MPAPKVIGKVDLSAGVTANVFTPRTIGATFNMRIVNRNAATALFTISFSAVSATLDDTQMLEYLMPIPSKGTAELTGLACSTEYLVAQSDVSQVSVVAYGIEV